MNPYILGAALAACTKLAESRKELDAAATDLIEKT